MPALQLAAWQVVVGYVQVVWTPSQAPPQPEPSLVQAVRAPTGAPVTGEQVPTWPARLQAWHWPPQAELQHTPSTHCPFAHWLAAVQAVPSASFGTQAPPEQ